MLRTLLLMLFASLSLAATEAPPMLRMPFPRGTAAVCHWDADRRSGSVEDRFAVDLSQPNHDGTIVAAADGVVSRAGENEELGKHVIISHGRYDTVYAHLADVLVNNRQRVVSGEPLGFIGGTGRSQGIRLRFSLNLSRPGRLGPSIPISLLTAPDNGSFRVMRAVDLDCSQRQAGLQRGMYASENEAGQPPHEGPPSPRMSIDLEDSRRRIAEGIFQERALQRVLDAQPQAGSLRTVARLRQLIRHQDGLILWKTRFWMGVMMYRDLGQLEQGRAFLEQVRTIETLDRFYPWIRPWALWHLSIISIELGECEDAARKLRQARREAQERGALEELEETLQITLDAVTPCL
ncbi:MAG: M23 family metallopeptidase [Myxococcota bacterium]